MKNILLLLLMLVSFSVQSQDCESAFIERFTKAYTKNQKWLNKKAKHIYEKYGRIDEVSFVFIPEISTSRDISNEEMMPNKIMCMFTYWNKKYTNVLVFKKSELLGVIDLLNSKYTPLVSHKYYSSRIGVFDKIQELQLNEIIYINGFSDEIYYWYIKNNELFVLTEQSGIKIYSAKDYLYNIYNPDTLHCFFGKSLYFKSKN